MNKKILRNSFIILALLLNSSCLTKYMWSDASYIENINQFLIGQDGRYIVLVGPRYHYVLTDKSGMFQKIITLRQEKTLSVNPAKSYLKLDSNNNISGYITIEGPFNVLPMEDIGLLTSLGIRPNKKEEISVKINLNGRRYSARNLGPSVSKSNTTYRFTIYYDDSGLIKDIGKAAVTPVTVGLDAVLFIGKAIVYPIKR